MRACSTGRCARSSILRSSPSSRTCSMDPKLLEILVCPVTKGPLVYDKERQELISKSARLAYPVRDGIPVMLEEEARKLDPRENGWAAARAPCRDPAAKDDRARELRRPDPGPACIDPIA